MKATLAELTKKKIGYTEDPIVKCENCKFYREEENKYVDRMWDSFCDVSNMVTLAVTPRGRCKKHERSI